MDTPTFVDGIGRRLRTMEATGEEVETFRLCRELSEAPSTEAALIERAGKLAGFTHASFSQVRRVERVRGALGGLTVVSAAVPGTRLSEVLAIAQRKWAPPDYDAALYLLEQVVSAMAAFHRHSRDLAHGALGPERIVIRPDGHPVIVEHVLSPAIGQLQMGRALLWTQFRVPVPAVAGTARLDQMTDIMQLGMLALALVLGRPIRREEFPQKLQELLGEISAPTATGPRPAVVRPLHGWILRTLQFETRSAFRTTADAAAALDALVAEQPRHKISPVAVVNYLASCYTADEGRARSVARGVAPSPVAPQAAAAPTAAVAPVAAAPPTTALPAVVSLADTPLAIAPLAVEAESIAAATEPDRSVTRRIRRDDTGALSRRDASPRHEASSTPGTLDDRIQSRRRSRVSSSRSSRQARESSFLARGVARARALLQQVPKLDWPSVRRVVRVAMVAVGLGVLFGVTYLGARGYLGLPDFIGRRGTLVVESHPPGAELYVDGLPSGQTPATLELRAGEHTLALRSGKTTTLVPVIVVSGARRVERVEIRQKRQTPSRPPAAASAPAASRAPAQELPSGRLPR